MTYRELSVRAIRKWHPSGEMYRDPSYSCWACNLPMHHGYRMQGTLDSGSAYVLLCPSCWRLWKKLFPERAVAAEMMR